MKPQSKIPNPQSKPLRLLVVEDSPRDAEIVVRELRSGGFDVTWKRVDTAETMRAALDAEPWDAVVSDYSMPGFDGLAALRVYQEKGLDIPFIIVSGKIGEETAVAAMKAGAQDYIMKDRLERLAPTMERELTQAETRRKRKQAEEGLRESEAKYRQLIESLNEGIWMIDEKAVTTFVNPRMAEMLGYTVEEMLGQHLFSFMDEQGIQIANRNLERRQQGIKEQHEFEFLRKDGTHIYTSLETSPVTDVDGNYRGAIASVADITERKRAEEEIARLAKFPSENPNPVLRLSRDSIVIHANAASDALLQEWGCALGGSAPQYWCDLIAQALASGQNKNIDVEVDGKIYSFFVVPIAEAGYVNLYGSEITQRKQVEEELRESEERTRQIINTALDAVITMDSNGRVSGWNPQAEIIFGWRSGDIIGKKMSETIIPSAQRDAHERGLGRFLHTGEPRILNRHLEMSAVRRDGGEIPVELTVAPVTIKGERQFSAFVRDITERKRVEAALRESEARHRTILLTAMDGFWRADLQGRLLEVNEAYCRMSGYTQEELLAMRISDLEAAESATETAAHIEKVMTHGEDSFETRHRRKDGSIFQLETNVQYKPEEGGQFIVFLKDITERKRTEEIVRDSEARYRALFQGTADGILIADLESRMFRYANPAICRLLGYSEAELQTMGLSDIHPKADLPAVMAEFEAQARGDKTLVVGLPCLRKDGTIVYADVNAGAMTIDGRVCNVGFFRDITERKRAEEALRESELRFRELFNRMSSGVAVYEAIDNGGDFIIKNFNPSAERIEKVSEKDILGKKVTEVLTGVKAFGIFEVFQRVWQTGKPEYFPPTIYKDERDPGSWRESWVSKLPSGEIVAIYDDITERKTSVDKLQSTIVGTVNTVALIVEARDPYTSGHQKRVAEISVAIAKELGLPDEQIKGLYFASLIHDVGKIHVPSEILSKPGKLTKLEFSLIKTHSKVGYELLKEIDFPWPIAEIVYQHHERVNGSGYPRKLKGNRISIGAKIIGLADVIEAMSSHRPYRPALGLEAALDEINKNKGILYDPDIVEAFVKVIKKDKTLIPSPIESSK